MSSLKEFQHLQIPLQELKSATNDFADTNCIGQGGFGKVYKGELLLSGGLTTAAVKRLDRKFGQGTPEFWKEIMFLSRYKHHNLVSLLGFCDEGEENILVYEYLSNKSLDLYLSSTSLSWHQRLNICIGAADGLKFLHEPLDGSQQRVLHRDIKSANILLDQNWQPKISDFGLSKFGPANQQFSFLFSSAVGTVGYCDPLYAHTGFLTKESDVYSFGVVLFEVLCGRPSYVQNDNDISRFLTVLARKLYEEKNLDTIVHVALKDIISPRSLEIFSAIAYQCLHIDRLQRPSMAKIVEELKNANLYQLIYENSPLQVPLKEIEEATNKFKMCIGRSAYTQTYKGDLSIFGKPTTVFIDRYREPSGHLLWLFLIQVHKLYCQPHPNILSILGYCDEDREKIIVFEYAERGTLDQYIRRSNTTSTTLMWLQRLEICVSTASAINHCHRTMFVNGYGTFESSKILLDDKWVAKVTDFWTSSPDAADKPAYFAPEFISNGRRPTKETNIYSFGMVLFEVLCGRLCTEVVDGYKLSAKLMKDSYEKKKLDEIVDPSLKVQMISSYSIDKFSTIAYRCLSDDPKERPSMDVVIKELQELRRIKLIYNNLPPQVPLKEIEVATDNYKMCIGDSHYSHIYKGDLSIFGTSTTVFIERYRDALSGIILKLFLIRVQNLFGHDSHPNVISCLGYCDEKTEKIIIYEYPACGRLDQYIRRNNTTSITLTWLQRLEICAGAASAVDHTHKKFEICYGCFESSKILLNDKWVAKVTDFWIFTPSSPDAVANPGYYAPEYISNRFRPTKETNVYSFGMVLFEVLCGGLCSEDVGGHVLSAKLIKDLYENKKLDEIVDLSLREQMISSYSVDKFSTIAYRCLLDDPKERPSMDAVIKELEELMKIEVEFEKRGKKLLERAKTAEERAKAAEKREKVATEREKKMQAEMELIEEELARERTLRKEMEGRLKEFN